MLPVPIATLMPNPFCDMDDLTILCPIMNDLLVGNSSHIIAQCWHYCIV